MSRTTDTEEKRDALGKVGLRANAHFRKIPHGIHRLDEPRLPRLLCPQVRLRIGLREHAGRADEVPGRERKARVAVVLLGGDVLRCDWHRTVKTVERGRT